MLSFLLSLPLIAAAPATTAPATDPATSTQPAKPAKAKRICRVTQMTGSNVGRRKCKTAEQWNAESQEGAQTLDAVNQGYKANTGNGSMD